MRNVRDRDFEDIFIKNLPTIDLHGYDRDSARVATDDFVEEAVLMKQERIVIIHGIGNGVVKEAVHEALRRNKLVTNHSLYGMNIGCTIVQIKKIW
ncbi:MAG: Smr/MutS family protein [Candidatus Aphodocola sp.]